MTTKIRGTALAPGVSANQRYYSPQAIRAAVEQAQPRVRSGQLLMRAHHDAADTLGVVGRVTSLRVAEDGSAQFEGELADTTTARDVRALIRGQKPFIDAVSIAGEWTGQIRRTKVGGQNCETADGVLLHSVDFTARPGIDTARIKVAESISGKRLFFESAGPVVPVPAERTAAEWAALTTEEFDQATGPVWANHFAATDDQRRAKGPSPFWRGLTR